MTTPLSRSTTIPGRRTRRDSRGTPQIIIMPKANFARCGRAAACKRMNSAIVRLLRARALCLIVFEPEQNIQLPLSKKKQAVLEMVGLSCECFCFLGLAAEQRIRSPLFCHSLAGPPLHY